MSWTPPTGRAIAGVAPTARNARYVRPEIVGDVEYRSRTSDGFPRHPSWKGLRVDETLADL